MTTTGNNEDGGRAVRPNRIPWPPLLFIGVVAAAWALQQVFSFGWPGMDDQAARLAGYALGIAGLALMAWSLITLRKAKTTFLPNKGASELVTTGPFRYRRHPIYFADMLILLGLAELTKNVWLVILTPVFAALVTWLAIRPEEQHLEVKFGEAYWDYKARTRMLV